uniref:Ig-like domain-containing protein n=1 Tax=Sphenodon punctatus TaxID=8508 RepID=A0A8D0L114_SPHPU
MKNSSFLSFPNIPEEFLLLNPAPSEPQAPTIEILQSIDQKAKTVKLMCLAYNYRPGGATVKWEGGSELFTERRTENGNYEASNHFTVPLVNWEEGKDYTCKVEHTRTNTNIIKKTSSKGPCSPPTPLSAFLLPPSLEDLFIAQKATVTCLVTGMTTPTGLEVLWSRGSGGQLEVTTGEPVPQANGTYNAVSVLKLCVEDWTAGETFTCTVKHKDAPSAIVKTIRKDHGMKNGGEMKGRGSRCVREGY